VARLRFAKANHSIVGADAELRAVNCFADCVWLAVPSGDEMAAHQRSDRRRICLYGDELRKRAFFA